MLILLNLLLLPKFCSDRVMGHVSSTKSIKWDIDLSPFSCSNNILDEKCRFDETIEIDANPSQFQDFIKLKVAQNMLNDKYSSELFEKNHSFCIHSDSFLNQGLLFLDKKFFEACHGFVSFILKPFYSGFPLNKLLFLFIDDELFIKILEAWYDGFDIGIFQKDRIHYYL